MAKIQKLQTKTPTRADIARWEMKKYSIEELFILFLVECWRDGTFTRKNEIPALVSFGFWFAGSEQGRTFWRRNCDKAQRAIHVFNQ